METTVYLVRHGLTDNKDQIVYGRMPGFSLNENGREAAKKIGKYLADKKITHIYTSPLERAFQTAEEISNFIPNVPITHKFELTETEATLWQGLKADELFLNDAYERFINDENAQIGTENLRQMAERMKKFIDEVVRNHKGQNIVCVSHEFPILALKLLLENKPLKSMKNYHLPTASALELKFDESGKFISSTEVHEA